MTFREILAGVQGNRRVIGTIRSTIDAFMPGKLDQTVSAKLIKGTADVVLFVAGQPVGIVVCEVIENVQALGSGELGKVDGGGPSGVAGVAGKDHL